MDVQYKIGEVELKNIFQNLPMGICVGYIDEETISDSIPIIMNDTVCKMIGFSKREIFEKFGNRFSNLVLQADRRKYQDAIQELYDFPHSTTLRYRLEKKEGDFISVEDQLQSVRNSDGKMWLYSCLTQCEPVEENINEKRRVEIQTFEHFNVLVDGQPVIFRSEKTKELLALLVDRKGAYVSNREIITNLWEDELVDEVTQARCRKVVFNLRKTLQIYGIEDLIESKMKGYRRLNVDMVNCDLYQYLSGDEKYANLFQGTYMEEYSWAEMTLSRLLFEE